MTADLAGLTAFPLQLHRRPDAEGQDGDQRIAEIVLYLHYRNAIDVKRIADGRGNLFGRLDQSPEKGMRRPGLEFGTRLRVGGDARRRFWAIVLKDNIAAVLKFVSGDRKVQAGEVVYIKYIIFPDIFAVRRTNGKSVT
jgi:hypothetical protein